MIALNNVISDLLAFLLEFAKLFPLLFFVFKFKFASVKRCSICIAVSLLIIVSCSIAGLGEVVSIISYVCVILNLCIFTGKYKILYGLVTYLSICIFDMLSASVYLLFTEHDYIYLTENKNLSFLINSVSLIVILLILIIIKITDLADKGSSNKVNGAYMFLIFLGELTLLAFITAFQLSTNDSSGLQKVMAVSLSIGSLIFIFIGITLFINYTSKNHYKELSAINEKLLSNKEQYYLMLLQKNNETIKFRHDIMNHFNCMHLLLNEEKYDELHEYFDKIGASLSELRPSIQVGNDVVSAILNDVSKKHPDVKLSVQGRIPDKIKLCNTDLCTVFYNLFSNAFEAADKSADRIVEVSFKILEDNLFCEIKNTVANKVEIINNTMKTQKQDTANHGHGVSNALRCAQRNGGIIKFSCNEEYFKAEMTI